MDNITFIHGSLSSGKGKIFTSAVRSIPADQQGLYEFVGSLDASEIYGGIEQIITIEHVLERAAHLVNMAKDYDVAILTGFGCSLRCNEIVKAYPNVRHVFLKHVNDAYSSLPQILERIKDTNTFTTEQLEYIYDVHLQTKAAIEATVEEYKLKWLPFNKNSIGEDGLPFETFDDSYQMMFCSLPL
jgi:hypothetical protein